MTQRLHYDYIKPGALPLNRLLFKMRADSAFRQRYVNDPAGVLASWDLTEDQRQAVLAQDMEKMVALGAHPMLAILVRIFTDVDQRPDKYELY